MRITFSCLLLLGVALCLSARGSREILLQLAPEPDAPVIAKITATEKVILDAAPARRNAELGWRQLALPTPFEGYVPKATINKDFSITSGTLIRYLPDSNSAEITEVASGDRYEVVREQGDWATVRFDKPVTGYFLLEATRSGAPVGIDPKTPRSPGRTIPAPSVPFAESAQPSVPMVEPLAIPAPRRPVNPDEPISQLDPGSLPPENVVWQPAAAAARSEGEGEGESESEGVAAARSEGEGEIEGVSIMVTPEQTQARETAPELGPDKTPRLLTGQLVRQIEADGPGYPIRLKSPEGRLIAFVNLSGIYLPDIEPYLGRKVYLKGQVHPLPEARGQLVILAENLRLAD